MRVFKNKWFNHWASKEGISDAALLNAAEEVASGKIDADLGGCLFKKRLPRVGAENEAATVSLWDTKGQIRKESFFCTHLPRTIRPTFLRRKKPL